MSEAENALKTIPVTTRNVMDDRNSLKSDLTNSVLYLAARDPQFRSELLEDPKTAIFSRCAIQIPESFGIRFIGRPPEVNALVVLPHFVGPP